MSSSIYTNTGIVESSWNARGLITHNFINKSLIRQDNGTLWAAVREGHIRKYINIYKSTDNGFSWKNMWSGTFFNTNRKTGITGLNANGPIMHLTLQEDLGLLHLFHSYYDIGDEAYNVELFSYEVGESSITRIDHSTTPGNTWLVNYFNINMDSLSFDLSYTDDMIYLTYPSFSKLYVRPYRHTYFISSDGGPKEAPGDNYFDVISTHAEDSSTLHIAAVRDFSPNYTIHYTRFDRLSGDFTTPVVITEFPEADVSDLNIAKDNNGAIIVYWSQKTPDDMFISEYYSISRDNGASWSSPRLIPTTAGQGDFTDSATNQRAGRSVAMACTNGFVISYVRNNNQKAITYVRTIDYNADTNEYVLSDEAVAASHPTKDVVGLRFFRPVGTGKLDLATKDQIRFAYQIGIATSTFQVDKSPVFFGQKLLLDEAYPSTVSVDFIEDSQAEDELLFTFNLLGSTSDNVDYYGEGLTGPLTEKYSSAFDRFGTSVYIEKYEPLQESILSDRSAYELTEVWYVKAFFQDINYAFPAPTGNENFQEFVERDMRKLHLPPDFHLSRTFLINDGNNLKRTVWLIKFDGNEYELSQVVPKFVDNQIVYYTVNAYVVGPSRNPFSRTILPSET